MIDRRQLLALSLALPFGGSALTSRDDWLPPARVAGEPDRPAWPPVKRFSLWPGKPPGAPSVLPVLSERMYGTAPARQLWLRGIAEPSVAVYRPARPDGRALIAIPGGSYRFLALQHEGIDVANRFVREGITVFVLSYRLPGEGWANRSDVPLQDAQRAIRLIRAHAATWKIDPGRIAIVGFSAGGHLAASLAVGYDEQVYPLVDAADHQSARPKAVGLVYPVITPSTTNNGGTFEELLGPDPDPAMLERRTPSDHVTAQTPPLFLAHALDDTLVQPENTLAMLAAARAAKVPVDVHLFEQGDHGFGLRAPVSSTTALWPDLFSRFLTRHL